MVEFFYNNAKNASTDYTPFELHYGYHSQVLFEEDVNSCLKSRSANKLVQKLRKLIGNYY